MSVVQGPCITDELDQYEIVGLSRGAFLKSAGAQAVLDAVDRDELSKIAASSEREIQNQRDEQSVRRIQLEDDITKSLREGYGIVSIKNPSSVICQTVEDKNEVHMSLASRNVDWLEVEGKTSPRVVSTSIDRAFLSAKRGECGAIYGSAESLRTLIWSLQRDKVSYSVLPLWFTQQDIDAEQKALDAKKALIAQRDEALHQKLKDDKTLDEIRKNESEKDREHREFVLREQNGPLARAFEGAVFGEIKAFAEAPEGPNIGVQQKWPTFVDWYKRKLGDQWELVSVEEELEDYGMANWKNRVLEAGFVRSRFKMKNRALGENDESCFSFGYILDKEFEVARDPIVVPCTDKKLIEQYKLGKSFSSRWLATPAS